LALIGALGCSTEPTGDEWDQLKRRIRERFPAVHQLGTAELAARRAANDDILLVDVREPDEFATSHIQGARNVPLDGAAPADFAAAFADVPKDREIVLYCSVGYRSSMAAERLHELGFEAVHNLEGSIFEWANDGRPLVDAAGPAERVHPFDAEWARFLKAERRAALSK
jgi:rhodanese-related sulfurtransferase